MPTLKNKIIVLIALILSSLHFLRVGNINFFGIYLILGVILFFNIPINLILSLIFLIYSYFIWIKITFQLVMFKMTFHMPVLKLILIMGSVITFQFIAILSLITSYPYLKKDIKQYRLSLIIFLTLNVLLIILRNKIKIPILILDRFGLHLGILEIFLLSLYGAYLGSKLIHPIHHLKLRKKIWLFFSIIFFGQLFLGLFVNSNFLMTGKLHFPIPALILAGPIYRGEGFFMLGLFLSTVLLVGPVWCSHLCYIGGLDAFASSIGKKQKIKKLSRKFAWFNLFLTIFLALLLKYLKISHETVLLLVVNFGIISLVFILFISPLTGKMSHCISWCPLGLVSLGLGKINPFRIKIDTNKCKSCNICIKECPYEAIDHPRKPTINKYCTLCGDCIAICPHNAIYLSFLGKKKELFYSMYIFLIIIIHTLFLGLARI